MKGLQQISTLYQEEASTMTYSEIMLLLREDATNSFPQYSCIQAQLHASLLCENTLQNSAAAAFMGLVLIVPFAGYCLLKLVDLKSA